MKTIKTALVVIALLGIIYGAYVMLNRSPQKMPPELAGQGEPAPLTTQLGTPTDPNSLAPTYAPSATPPASIPAGPASADTAGTADIAGAPPWNGRTPSGSASPDEIGPSAAAPRASLSGVDFPASNLHAADSNTARTAPADPFSGKTTDPLGSGMAARGDTALPAAPTAFDTAWESAQTQIRNRQLAEALFTLSLWYDNPDLTAEQQRRLVDLLDKLAGTVIYSREHLLERRYEVRRGETLEDIAKQYQVPREMLAYINGIDASGPLEPGTVLKVVRGPFNAIVSISKRELTLMLAGRYAGRFPVEVGADVTPSEVPYRIRDKMTPGEASNGYQRYWLDLGDNLCILEKSERAYGSGPNARRSLQVSTADARDLYAILSRGSPVVIKR